MNLLTFVSGFVFIALILVAWKKRIEYKNKLKQDELSKQAENNYREAYSLQKEAGIYHDIANKTIVSDKPMELTRHESWLVSLLAKENIFLPQFILVDNYFRMKNGKTIQIDVIAVGKRGVFVIESKDYKGWIFGNSQQDRWVQRFSNGEKYYFYNPIKQNFNHIRALREIVGEQRFISMVAFGLDAELKAISYVPKDTYVVAGYRIKEAFADIGKSYPEILSLEQVLNICRRINAARIKSDDKLRDEHIKQIKDETGEDRVYG